MIQHIFPKGFQRVRYYGLQATASFKKWYGLIAKVAGDLVDAMMSDIKRISYADFFEEVAGRDPLTCKYCGGEMALVGLSLPKYGVFSIYFFSMMVEIWVFVHIHCGWWSLPI